MATISASEVKKKHVSSNKKKKKILSALQSGFLH